MKKTQAQICEENDNKRNPQLGARNEVRRPRRHPHLDRSIPLAIAEHRRRAFSEAFTRTVDAIIEAGGDYVFTGHYHQRCREKRLLGGGWILTPGSFEIYNFGERLSNLIDRDTAAYDEYLDLFQKYMVSPP